MHMGGPDMAPGFRCVTWWLMETVNRSLNGMSHCLLVIVCALVAYPCTIACHVAWTVRVLYYFLCSYSSLFICTTSGHFNMYMECSKREAKDPHGSFACSLAALGTLCYRPLRFFACSLAVLVQQVMSHCIYIEKRIPHCNSTAGENLDTSEFIQTLHGPPCGDTPIITWDPKGPYNYREACPSQESR